MTQNTVTTQAKQSKTPQLNDRILRWPEVQQRTGLCRSHVHALAKKGKFPPPVKLGARASGWIEADINAWIEDRIESSRANKASDEENDSSDNDASEVRGAA